MVRRQFALFLTSALLFHPLRALAFDNNSVFLLLDAELLGGYSKVVKRNGVASAEARWSVSPSVKINEFWTWINLYDGHLNRSSQVVAQEEGGRQTETEMSHGISTAFKWSPNKMWSLRPLFFSDWTYVNETEDEAIGEGLYDYHDLGASLESILITKAVNNQRESLRVGFRFFDRHYPNYQSLLSQVLPSGQVAQTHEKDFDGYKAHLSFDSAAQTGWSYGAEIVGVVKAFDDKKTVDRNGILQDENRQDWQGFLNGYVSHPLAKEFQLRLDAQTSINSSNLDFYDTHNTVSLVDDDFIENYFDSTAWGFRPSLVYSKALSEKRSLSLAGAYSYFSQNYTSRQAQNSVGVYQAKDQRDTHHIFSLRFSYPITTQVAWVSKANYTLARSNQEFEQFYLYSYDRWNVLSGITFSY